MDQPGQSGASDVYIDNAETVGDFRTVLARLEARIETIEHDVAMNASGSEQQLAALRHELRGVQANGVNNKFDLVDMKTMTPAIFTGARSENFRTWAKRVKAYTNARLPGYRQALEEVEKLGQGHACRRASSHQLGLERRRTGRLQAV